MKPIAHGFSLLELLITIALIIIIGWGSTHAVNQYKQHQLRIAVAQFESSVRLLRLTAITQQQSVTWCIDTRACSSVRLPNRHQPTALLANENRLKLLRSAANGLLTRWGTALLCLPPYGKRITVTRGGRVRSVDHPC
jgi:prepilin-type N-terminal cleavage/methylation domain-containing protein